MILKMVIYIKMTRKTIELKEVSWNETISQIKRRIQDIEGILLDKQCITFDNKKLYD